MDECVVLLLIDFVMLRPICDRVVRSRTLHVSVQPRIMPLPDDHEDGEAGDSDDSDLKSKMSFSYWGADKITLQKPVTSKTRYVVRGVPTSRVTTYNRQSSLNAKFGTRLLSAEPLATPPCRPSWQSAPAVTPVRRRIDKTTMVKSTVSSLSDDSGVGMYRQALANDPSLVS